MRLLHTILMLFCAFLSSWAQSGEFFIRSAKWSSSHLSPSGGALVSGRGNFRPGFFSRDWRAALSDPSFAVKRSSSTWLLPRWPSHSL